MLIDLARRRGRNLLKFIARKIGEKEFTFSECARSPMKTAANSKFMTLFGVHNCRRRRAAGFTSSAPLWSRDTCTDSRVVVSVVVRSVRRSLGRRTH